MPIINSLGMKTAQPGAVTGDHLLVCESCKHSNLGVMPVILCRYEAIKEGMLQEVKGNLAT